jgi:hypothetical protein
MRVDTALIVCDAVARWSALLMPELAVICWIVGLTADGSEFPSAINWALWFLSLAWSFFAGFVLWPQIAGMIQPRRTYWLRRAKLWLQDASVWAKVLQGTDWYTPIARWPKAESVTRGIMHVNYRLTAMSQPVCELPHPLLIAPIRAAFDQVAIPAHEARILVPIHLTMQAGGFGSEKPEQRA